MIGRPDYDGVSLELEAMDDHPVAEFGLWLARAEEAELPQPNAMVLATAHGDRPSARTVLLKGFDAQGFVFYTNYESRKGRELDANGRAALTFTWLELHRQVRIEGEASRVSTEESDRYYATRPRGAQLAAGISRQSEVIVERSQLEEAFAAAEEKFADGEIPRPDYWGGFRVQPDVIEFWQGQPNRLHDRVRYRIEGDAWVKERLSP